MAGVDCAQAVAGAEEFELRNDPPPHRPRRFESGERTRQRALIAGLDCLAGQGDLFDVDGEGRGDE